MVFAELAKNAVDQRDGYLAMDCQVWWWPRNVACNVPAKQLGPNRLSGVGAEGPAQPVGLRARANSLGTRKLLAAQRSFGGAIGELEQSPHDRAMQSAPTTSSTQGNGSLTNQRAEHPAGSNGSCQFAPYYFPPRSLSGALFRRPNSQRGKRECRVKLKILFVSSSLRAPVDF